MNFSLEVGKIAVLILVLSPAWSLQSQGTVYFANVGVGLDSPFFENDGMTRLGAGTYTVELWAGPDANSLALAGPAYMGSFVNGYFDAGERLVSNVTGNTAVAMVRIWDNQGGTVVSWDQAVISAPGLRAGSSAPFAITVATPPSTPATLINMPSVSFFLIPEPSTIALGLFAVIGLCAFGRSTRRQPTR